MPDTGSPWNIPYVENADLVRDWPADSLLVANAVAAGLSAAGGLVQVVTATDATSRETTSATFVTANLSAALTPSAIGNTVIATWQSNAETLVEPGVESEAGFRITDGASALVGAANRNLRHRAAQAAFANAITTNFTVIGVYTTVGTSAITFTCEFKNISGSRIRLNNATDVGHLSLMEVKV